MADKKPQQVEDVDTILTGRDAYRAYIAGIAERIQAGPDAAFKVAHDALEVGAQDAHTWAGTVLEKVPNDCHAEVYQALALAKHKVQNAARIHSVSTLIALQAVGNVVDRVSSVIRAMAEGTAGTSTILAGVPGKSTGGQRSNKRIDDFDVDHCNASIGRLLPLICESAGIPVDAGTLATLTTEAEGNAVSLAPSERKSKS